MSAESSRADQRASIVIEPREVAPGLAMLSVRTPTLPPATHTNAYLAGERELVLIEPASPYDEEIERLAGWVERALSGGARLKALLLTHHHPDHAGGAARLRARLGAPIWAHAATAERLHGRVPVDRELTHGELIALEGPTPLSLEVVHTPGHAPGHLCFWEPHSRSLIAGDMVASVGTILIDTSDGDMQAYLASLSAMDALGAQQLLPAHGLPIGDPHERLTFYIRHRLAREEKVAAALRELGRESSPDELVPIAYADTAQIAWPLARLSAEAHLVKLEREGRVGRRGARWSWLGEA